MSNENAKIDDNRKRTLLGVTDDADEEIRRLLVDPTTGRLLVSAIINVDLDDLDSVVITSPADNEVLAYDDASGKWINQVGDSGESDHGELDGLADDDHSQYALLSGRNGDTLAIDQIKAYDGAGLKLTDDDDNGIFVEDGGNVGIGTTSPKVPLHVSQNSSTLASSISTALTTGGYTAVFSDQAGVSAVGNLVSSNTSSQRGVSVFLRTRGTFATPSAVQADDYLGDLLFGGYDGSAFQYGAGVFGFVDGSVSSGSVPMRLSFVTGASNGTREERLTVKNNGSVGIGTTDPEYALDIQTNNYKSLRLHRDYGGGSGAVYMDLALDNAAGEVTTFARIAGFSKGVVDGAEDGELRLYTMRAGTMTEAVRIDEDGNMGIGVIPDTKLDVNGAITARELSADPSDPDEGSHVTWQSDGTGSGDDGDIMMKITAGGSTKTVTLVDFSVL